MTHFRYERRDLNNASFFWKCPGCSQCAQAVTYFLPGVEAKTVYLFGYNNRLLNQYRARDGGDSHVKGYVTQDS